MVRRILLTAMMALSLAVVASGAPAASAGQSAEVAAADFVFDPETITVAPGTTVIWTNTGNAPHTVTADDNSYDSGRMNSGDVFTQTYDTPGTFGYFCVFHGSPGSGMAATVVVVEVGDLPTPPDEPAAPDEPATPDEPDEPVGLPAVDGDVAILSPADGATITGTDVTITIDVTGTTLVPAAQATRLEDLHVHYLLDVDPAPFLSGDEPIPTGQPNIVHTVNTSQTFNNVSPGEHTVTVILAYSSHQAVQPVVAPSVTFTVVAGGAAPAPSPLPPAPAPNPAPQVPGALPNTGDGPTSPGGIPNGAWW